MVSLAAAGKGNKLTQPTMKLQTASVPSRFTVLIRVSSCTPRVKRGRIQTSICFLLLSYQELKTLFGFRRNVQDVFYVPINLVRRDVVEKELRFFSLGQKFRIFEGRCESFAQDLEALFRHAWRRHKRALEFILPAPRTING